MTAAVVKAMQDMRAEPANSHHKRHFIAVAGEMPVETYDPAVAEALTECLKTPGVDCSWAEILWVNMLFLEPGFRAMAEQVLAPQGMFARGNPFEKIEDLSPLVQPYFIAGLKKIVAPALRLEILLTRLRAFFLSCVDADELDDDSFLTGAAALAMYCFNTGYIFDITAAEEKAVAALRGRDDAIAVAVQACYGPLHRLENVDRIVAAAEPALADVIVQQVDEPRALARRAAEIVALTAVDDGMSLKVKGMYEDSPYPRWRELHEMRFSAWPEDKAVLEKPGAKALVAGCGTGRESAQLAALYPAADILGIDITRASLAYGSERAAALGLKNLTYRQADILKLPGVLKPEYDYVHCVGVLHHMAAPMDGWRVLKSLVKPGGLMYIGLYGEIPRRSIVAARAAIAKGRYPDTDEGMRAFRRDSTKLLSAEHLATLRMALDYYYLPMYRDLLFHVNEHRFTIPQIRASLAELKLSFRGFKLPDTVFAEFKKTHADVLDLGAWEAFECAHPDTFIHSYKFWCG